MFYEQEGRCSKEARTGVRKNALLSLLLRFVALAVTDRFLRFVGTRRYLRYALESCYQNGLPLCVYGECYTSRDTLQWGPGRRELGGDFGALRRCGQSETTHRFLRRQRTRKLIIFTKQTVDLFAVLATWCR